MLELNRKHLILPIALLLGVGSVFAVCDDPEPAGPAIGDGPDPIGRSSAVAVIIDGPEPVDGVVRLPAGGTDDPDPFGAAIDDDADPIHPMVICFMDEGFDCAYLEIPR